QVSIFALKITVRSAMLLCPCMAAMNSSCFPTNYALTVVTKSCSGENGVAASLQIPIYITSVNADHDLHSTQLFDLHLPQYLAPG
ncbi:uncharacterized protein B0H18DRAFT_986566, partial [Fomitopsis serialis]|uniref:uncharacterized protein n=1 Tax=Fomitopsis serialis TaxID=139415 RepID=UPI0020077E1A